jgi:hypothetical protein
MARYEQSFVDQVHAMKKRGSSLKELEKEFDLSHGQIKYILYRIAPSSNETDVVTSPDDLPPFINPQRERLFCTNELVYPKTLRQRIRSFFGWFFS